MVDKNAIREHMPVVGSDNQQIETVDHLDGDSIKLTKDHSPDGKHHWIPLSWVTRVDTSVHLDRTADQAKREWSDTPPPNSGGSQGQSRGASA